MGATQEVPTLRRSQRKETDQPYSYITQTQEMASTTVEQKIAMEPRRVCQSTILKIFLTACILCCTSAMIQAAIIQERSYNNLGFTFNPNGHMHIADGMLRDLMMLTADQNRDNKLSEAEITWFYRNVALYSDYVSQQYGQMFTEYADTDNDGLLDPDELLHMLVAMEASNWTRR